MTVPANDGCVWPVDTACFTDEWEANVDEPNKVRSIALASNTLYRLTGYRVGGCPVKLRPCRPGCTLAPEFYHWRGFSAGGGFLPYSVNGMWYNACGCDTVCHHNTARVLMLPPPNGGVSEVKVDGANLVEGTDYWVDGTRLIRLNADWPLTQDLDLPDTQVGTFSVTYLNSYPVDGQGAYAAAQLAMEFAKACTGAKGCRLPTTVVSVVRQGVTFNLPTGSFPGGETGIREVDAYIGLWNPTHKKYRPKVWSP